MHLDLEQAKEENWGSTSQLWIHLESSRFIYLFVCTCDWPYNPATGFQFSSAHLVCTESLSH